MTVRILTNLVDGTYGGLQILTLRLAQHLQQLGNDVRLVARFTRAAHARDHIAMEPPQKFAVSGVDVEIIAVQGWRLWLLGPVPFLLRHLKTFRIGYTLYHAAFKEALDRTIEEAEVVHYIGIGWELLGMSAMACARRRNIPFVVEPAWHIGQRGDGPVDWRFYRQADLVIVHTESEAEAFREKGVRPAHIHVLRHGFDALPPGDGARFRKAHRIEGPMVLFVGRRCDEKGYFMLLEAFAHLRQKMPTVTLVIVGAGEVAPSTAEGVLELGPVSDETRQDALDACTVFCMPSRGESFGMAYFEAWNCTRPVVALDLPALRETIGASGGGFLAEWGDILHLVEKLQLVLTQPELAKAMGARGREFSLRYSWNDAAKSCAEAYAKARQNCHP